MAEEIERGIIQIAKDHSGLDALISARIYFNVLKQNATLPAVVVSQIDAVREDVMGGATGLVESRFQFDIFDDDKSGLEAAAEQVRLAYHNYSGDVTATGGGTVTIDWVRFEDERDFFEEEVTAKEFRKVLDFVFHYRENLS